MEQEAASETAPAGAKRSRKSLILVALVGLASAAAGFAVPQLMGGGSHAHKPAADPSHEAPAPKNEHASVGLSCVPFGEVVANLDDNRMMRYVRAKFALSVAEADAKPVEHLIEANRTVLKNWLIGYLQNKQVDEVRGTEGFNRIRREVQERFNEMLYPGGEEKIKEVLFEEFNVQ